MSASKQSSKLIHLLDKISDLFAWLSVVLLAAITFLVCAEVIIRKFWNISMVGVIEISEHALVFITFLSAGWILRNDGHVKVDVVVGFLRPKTQATLNMATSCFGALLCLFLSYHSGLTIWSVWQRGVNSVKILELPLAPLYSAVFLGFIILFFQCLRRAHFFLEERIKLTEKK